MNNDFNKAPEDLDKNDKNQNDFQSNGGSIWGDKRFKIAFVAFILAISLVCSVMTTFTLTKRHYEKKLVAATENALMSGDVSIAELDQLFQKYSFYELDSDALIEQALRAYIKATGDKYARYYNAEEYAAVLETRQGVSAAGLGVNITYDETEKAILILRVLNGSPAEKKGLKAGDLIFEVILDDGTRARIEDIGYTAAAEAIRKEEGEIARFAIKRFENAEFKTIEFEVPIEKYPSDTVDYRICSTDSTVGIITIVKFDLMTPKLFKEAVEAMKEQGISKIVFDIRDNPGGDLASIIAILSYFRNEGETLLSVKTRDGTETEYKCVERSYGDATYSECAVKSEEIGMYRGFTCAVLINGDTASAAELFASNFRDASLGTLVGTTTYGKGILQTTYPFGTGAVKLTTKAYFPPCGISYDGIGIAPSTNYEVELSEEAAAIHKYIREDAIDNQLQMAIAALNK